MVNFNVTINGDLVPESNMSDLTRTQTDYHMKTRTTSRAENNVRPWQQVVHDHNKKPMIISLKRNGQLVSTITGYRKERKI